MNLGKAKKYEILLEPVFHTMTIAHKLIRISLLPYFKNIYVSTLKFKEESKRGKNKGT